MDHDLFKVPDDVIINLLKKEIAGLRSRQGENEMYIVELEERITKLLKCTDDDRLALKADRRIADLNRQIKSLEKKVESLKQLNNHCLVQIMNYEKEKSRKGNT
jgi:TolA-binding protein